MFRVVSMSVAGAAFAVSFLLAASPAQGQSRRPPAEATQHALDELANCQEQSRLGLRTDGSTVCPTDTPTPTLSPTPLVPTPTSAPTDLPPTDVPPPATPTPGPCWLTDATWGDPDNGGIVFVPLSDADGNPVVDDDGNQQYGPIQIPCDSTPTPEPTPTDTATDVPTPAATMTPAPAPAPRAASAPAAAPAARPAQVVVQTVVVEVTPVPTQTPTATASASATPTGTPRPSSAPAAYASPSASVVVSPVPSPTPVVAARSGIPDWIRGPWGIVAIVGTLVGGVAATIGGLLLKGYL